MAKKTATKKSSSEKVKTVKMEFLGKEREINLVSKFDTRGFSKEQIIDWYRQMHLGRRLDEKAALYLKQAKGWSYHASFAGHDGIQLALGSIVRQGKDFIFPYYRDMMTSLAGGITVEEIILNGLSKDTDVAGGGRHMSNHFAKPSMRIENVSSCTGNHAQHATGLARAVKKYKGDEVVYYSSGESAWSEGYVWEALNVASLEMVPAIFVVQNNGYGISVPLSEQTANRVVSDNYKGFKNMKIIECDGKDPFDSYRALEEAQKHALSGKGPVIVHADCVRIYAHSNSDPHTLYRTPEELEDVAKKDPLFQFRHLILDKKLLTIEELEELEKENQERIFEAADKAEAAPEPSPESWKEFILPEPYVSIDDNTESEHDENAETITYLQGLNTTLKEEFRRNPDTFLWGQDVASKKKGGVFNVNKGMMQEFGNDRIFNSPIAENNIVGTANGFSRYSDKIRVVVEGAEFADYFWPAMDQLIECSHEYWRTKGQFTPNVVIRLASGGYIQGGLYHSQNLEAVFTSLPGLRVVTPAFADDAAGLMRNAIRSKGPTLFLEPKFLYNFKRASTPKPKEDYVVPFGKSKIRKSGSDLTIVSYGTGVHMSLLAAEELEKEGISAEVLDLRTLVPLDKDGIRESLKKTNRVLIVHEDNLTGGFGGEISAIISEEMFNYLDAPVKRLASEDCPVGFSKILEDAVLINPETVKKAAKELMDY